MKYHRILSYAWSVLDRKEKVEVIQGEFGAARKAGVRLLEKMPEKLIVWFLQRVHNVSHGGQVLFNDCYKVLKKDRKSLVQSVGGFYEKAVKVSSSGEIS